MMSLQNELLKTWRVLSRQVGCWPTKLIFSRLEQAFADGRIDDHGRADLQELLASLVGGTASLVLSYDAATTLPLCTPPPPIGWAGETYVFTGRFAYGARRECEREVTQRGGTCQPDVTRRTTFLVIGTFGSRDWVHSSYGRKIQHAVELRASGQGLKIVGENHWASALAIGS